MNKIKENNIFVGGILGDFYSTRSGQRRVIFTININK